MKKVIVVSDSHGLIEPLEQIYERYKDEVDLFIHCGDSELEHDHPLFHHYHPVKGNCDWGDYPLLNVHRVGGFKILVTHGHQHHVNFSLMKLAYLGLENEADIVCYGHTHMPSIEQRPDGFLLLNPGSVSKNRGYRPKPECFALVTLGKTISVEFINVKNFKPIESHQFNHSNFQ